MRRITLSEIVLGIALGIVFILLSGAAIAGQLCTIDPPRPGPTMVPPEQIIASAEDMGFGWAAWAQDDVNLPNCKASDAWFSMTTTCGRYTGLASDLTMFGQTIVPILQATARPAHL